MDARCRIELLGGLRVLQGDRIISRFRTQKTAALLAYLAYHPQRSHAREELVEIFWPESDPAQGRNNLSQSLSSLRHMLEPPGVPAGIVIQADRATVRLNPAAVTTDVAEFEAALDASRQTNGRMDEWTSGRDRSEAPTRPLVHSSTLCRQLADAVTLYRGELLVGFYEEWIASEQARLAVLHQHALRRLATHYEQAGEPDRALDVARRAVAADPLSEVDHRELIRLLAAAGQPAAALCQYQELERLLKEELGTAPAAATRVLAQKVQLQAGAGRMDERTKGQVEERASGRSGPISSIRPLVRSSTHPQLPQGTVTFLLTDIEGSTAGVPGGTREAGRRVAERAAEAYRAALADHHALLRTAFREHGGQEVKEAGDSFVVAFERAGDALAAAVAAQRRLRIADCAGTREAGGRIADCPDPTLASSGLPSGSPNQQSAIRNPQWKMALHSGDVELAEGAYRGLALHRAARLLAAAHGGQVLCSLPAAELLRRDLEAGIHLRDLGIYRLRDLPSPERLFQVEYPDLERPEGGATFPPPNAEAAYPNTLALQLTRFFGRQSEIERLAELLTPGTSGRVDDPEPAPAQSSSIRPLVRGPAARFAGTHATGPRGGGKSIQPRSARLVTLTGTGGTGKTRLALAVAERLLEAFGGAVWFAPLVDLREAERIPDALLDALRVPRSPGMEPLEQVVEFLTRQPSLLVLDNLEQLLSIADCGGLTPGPSPQPAWRGGTELTPGGRRAVPGGTSPPTSASAPRVVASVSPLHAVCGEGPGVRPPGEAAVRNPQSAIELVQLLLARVPALTILATSRRSLGLGGEREFVVQPLPVPEDARLPEQLTLFESVQLFTDRAQAVRPDFQVTAHHAPAIAELCNRLEGIPLAIELAASRAQVLTPAQMLQQLEQRFDFLVSRRRDLPDRHRSIRAALDWSYDLLSPELQQFFARLSVFRGGWTLEAAEAVCMDVWRCGGVDEENRADTSTPPHVHTSIHPLDALAQLRECSLMLAEETEQGMRFRMLETVREYAAARLSPEEADVIRRRHAEYFLALAERTESQLSGTGQSGWLKRLESEHDNFRAALDWGRRANREAQHLGMRIAAALWSFWERRGHVSEGRAYLAAFLSLEAASDRPRERAAALHATGCLAWRQADYMLARSALEECLTIRRALGMRLEVADTLNVLGNTLSAQGCRSEARPLYEEALTINRELDNRRGEAKNLSNLGHWWNSEGDPKMGQQLEEQSLAINRERGDRSGMLTSLLNLGVYAYQLRENERGRALTQEALVLAREQENPRLVAFCLGNLGHEALDSGDYPVARRYLSEALAIKRSLESRYDVAVGLDQLGSLAAREDRPARATRLFGAAGALRDMIGAPWGPDEIARCGPALASARDQLGEAAFTAAYEAGRALSWQAAVAEALGEGA